MSEAKQIYHVPVLLNESVDGLYTWHGSGFPGIAYGHVVPV